MQLIIIMSNDLKQLNENQLILISGDGDFITRKIWLEEHDWRHINWLEVRIKHLKILPWVKNMMPWVIMTRGNIFLTRGKYDVSVKTSNLIICLESINRCLELNWLEANNWWLEVKTKIAPWVWMPRVISTAVKGVP